MFPTYDPKESIQCQLFATPEKRHGAIKRSALSTRNKGYVAVPNVVRLLLRSCFAQRGTSHAKKRRKMRRHHDRSAVRVQLIMLLNCCIVFIPESLWHPRHQR